MTAALCQKILLQTVSSAIEKPPSRESLLFLLKLFDPNLCDKDLDDGSKRESAKRKVTLVIHPDKVKASRRRKDEEEKKEVYDDDEEESQVLFLGEEPEVTTKRFQDFQNFYYQACKPWNLTPPIMAESQFHIKDKKHYLFDNSRLQVPSSQGVMTYKLVSSLVGYTCMNIYGAAAHEKVTEKVFDFAEAKTWSERENCVTDLFNEYGGYELLSSVEAIKTHLIEKGPVVSNSFILTRAFFDACEHSTCFEKSLVGSRHPVLIVGYKTTALGDMWLINAVRGKRVDIPVYTGQFSIETEAIAPISDFSDLPWQDESLAFDAPMDGWDLSWKIIIFYLDGSKLETLFEVIDCTLFVAISSKKRFVLRDEKKKAKSRWVHLTDVAWRKEYKDWEVSVKLCE
jgi:hypothetical protein